MALTSQTLTIDFEFGLMPKVSLSSHSFNLGDKEMSWNYRVVFDDINALDNEIGEYTVREVFYDEDGEIDFWGDDAAVPNANSYDELQEDMNLFMEAFELPCLVLTVDEETGEEALVEWVSDEESDEDEEEVDEEDEE
jgi:hypothetical protein